MAGKFIGKPMISIVHNCCNLVASNRQAPYLHGRTRVQLLQLYLGAFLGAPVETM